MQGKVRLKFHEENPKQAVTVEIICNNPITRGWIIVQAEHQPSCRPRVLFQDVKAWVKRAISDSDLEEACGLRDP
jgi:hypothetical protein